MPLRLLHSGRRIPDRPEPICAVSAAATAFPRPAVTGSYADANLLRLHPSHLRCRSLRPWIYRTPPTPPLSTRTPPWAKPVRARPLRRPRRCHHVPPPDCLFLTCTLGPPPCRFPRRHPREVVKKSARLATAAGEAQRRQGGPRPTPLDLLAFQVHYPGTPAAARPPLVTACRRRWTNSTRKSTPTTASEQPKELRRPLERPPRALYLFDLRPTRDVGFHQPHAMSAVELTARAARWRRSRPCPRYASPDGKTLATGRHDTLVRLWDVTGQRRGGITLRPTHRPFAFCTRRTAR